MTCRATPRAAGLQQRKEVIMAAQQHTGNSGNFAQDRERASRAGHVGGQHSSGNFARDRQRAVEAGRKGGQSRGSHSPGEQSRAERADGEIAGGRQEVLAGDDNAAKAAHHG
jgi:general stress protein YciG